MSTDKSGTCWDERSTRIFLEQCIDQILKNERKGGSFTAAGWINIMYGFYRNSGKSLEKKQLKNRYDSLKKEWRVWDKLFSKETGISYDSVNHKVLAEDEWWDRKVQENPDYAKYRYHGIKFASELEMVFKDGVLSGSTQFSPSARRQRRQMPPPDDKDDVYQPTMDLEEGSGDSEEELLGATTGVSAPLEGLNLTTSTQPSAPSGATSIGKRKRGQGSNGGRRKKLSASKQIADCLSVIATATKGRTHQLQNSNHDVSITYIASELRKIPEIAIDRDFRRRCLNMMMHDICRDMFVGLKEDKDDLVEWLKHHAYNTPLWQEPPTN